MGYFHRVYKAINQHKTFWVWAWRTGLVWLGTRWNLSNKQNAQNACASGSVLAVDAFGRPGCGGAQNVLARSQPRIQRGNKQDLVKPHLSNTFFVTLTQIPWLLTQKKGHVFQNIRGQKSIGLCTPPRSITNWSFLGAMSWRWEVFPQKTYGFYILNWRILPCH